MHNFDRPSVFSLATTEAAPAGLAQGHSRWLRFCLDRRYSSTSLPPLTPSPLRDFTATMEALTPVGPVLRHPTSGSMNAVSVGQQVSLIHVSDLPIPPSPTTLGPSMPISHATPHLIESPTLVGLGFTFLQQAGRLSGRIEFVILRMDRSPPVALHATSGRRSYLQLRAGKRLARKGLAPFNSCAPTGAPPGLRPPCPNGRGAGGEGSAS